MPSLKKKETIANLRKKGFSSREGDHVYLHYTTLEGKLTGIRTKISHSSKGDIHSGLVSAMAKQCHLQTSQFVDFAKCSISQNEYERILQASGVLRKDGSE